MPRNIPVQALLAACRSGDAAAVSRLLPAGGTRLNLSGQRYQEPNTKGTPLIRAAMNGHIEIVRMILERAPNTKVDHVDGDGDTALLVAAEFHHANIIQLLAERGANVSLVGQQGCTPLRLAVGQVHPDAPPRDPDPNGARQLSTVRALLRLGAGTLPSPPAPLVPPPAPAQPFFEVTFPPKTFVCHSRAVCLTNPSILRPSQPPTPSTTMA